MTQRQKLERLLVATKGAIAALSQPKTYPGDIALAKSFLSDAVAACSHHNRDRAFTKIT